MSLTSAGVVDVTISGSGGAITGSGASGQVTLWSAPSVVTGDSGFTWAGTGATLDIVVVKDLLGHADFSSLRSYVQGAGVERTREALRAREATR